MTNTAVNPLPAFKTDEGKARYMAAYDAVLAEWPVPCESVEVPTRLGTTHAIVSGAADAPPLVLLPSFAASATVWRLNVAGLSRRYRTIAVDVIGQAGKSVVNQPLRNRRQYADWLNDVLDGLGIARASFVGCSFGGFLALNQASLAPDRVARVVLISPVGAFASQYWKLTFLMRIKRPVLKFVRRLLRRPEPATPMAPPRDARWGALIAATMSAGANVSIIRASAFSGVELRAIRAPTLLLIGDAEPLYEPHAALKHAQSRMPALAGAIVPGADHIAAMAQPDDVNARIIQFVQ